jgi:hypothetical protein
MQFVWFYKSLKMLCTGVVLPIKLKYMKPIKVTMLPKNHSALRSILKQEQGEKTASSLFNLNNTQATEEYLNRENIIYEVYNGHQWDSKEAEIRMQVASLIMRHNVNLPQFSPQPT